VGEKKLVIQVEVLAPRKRLKDPGLYRRGLTPSRRTQQGPQKSKPDEGGTPHQLQADGRERAGSAGNRIKERAHSSAPQKNFTFYVLEVKGTNGKEKGKKTN